MLLVDLKAAFSRMARANTLWGGSACRARRWRLRGRRGKWMQIASRGRKALGMGRIDVLVQAAGIFRRDERDG